MKVNIGILKNELSKYLGKVKLGEEVTVTDRNEPVAKIIPITPRVKEKDMSQWLSDHKPLGKKSAVSSTKILRSLRDEDE